FDTKRSYSDGIVPSGSTPRCVLAWACGSRSSTHTRLPLAASAAARFTVVVVLPTPPFWLITAIRRMVVPFPAVSSCHPSIPPYNLYNLSANSPTLPAARPMAVVVRLITQHLNPTRSRSPHQEQPTDGERPTNGDRG